MEKDRDEDGAINSNSRPVCLFLPANLIFIVFDTAQRLKNACRSSTCTTLVHICFAVIPFLLSGLCDCRCWGLNSLSLPGTLFSLSLSHATARFISFYFFYPLLIYFFLFSSPIQSSSPDPSESPSARPSKSGERPKRSAGFFCCRVHFFLLESLFLPSFSLLSLHSSLPRLFPLTPFSLLFFPFSFFLFLFFSIVSFHLLNPGVLGRWCLLFFSHSHSPPLIIPPSPARSSREFKKKRHTRKKKKKKKEHVLLYFTFKLRPSRRY